MPASFPDTGVDLAPLRGRDAAVGHLVGEGVRAGVLAGDPDLVEELRRAQSVQEQAQLLLARARERGQHLHRHRLADGGRGLQQPALAIGQAVDAGTEDLLHGVRHRDVLGRPALLAHGARELLEEEGIALRLAHDPLAHRIGEPLAGEEAAQHAAAVLRTEGLERDLGEVRPLERRGPVPGPVGHDQEQRHPLHGLEHLAQRLGGGVHPVDVLDGDDEGPLPRRAEAHLAQDLGGPHLDPVGAVGVEALGALLDADESEQEGQRALQVDADARQ